MCGSHCRLLSNAVFVGLKPAESTVRLHEFSATMGQLRPYKHTGSGQPLFLANIKTLSASANIQGSQSN